MRAFCHERFAECWASREILATARCFSVKRLAIRWGWHYLCFTITKRLYEKTKQKKMCNRAVCHKSQSAALLSELIMYFTTLPAPSSSAFGFWPFWRTFEAKPKSSSWHTPQRRKENGHTENEWKDPLDVHPAIQSRTLSSHGQRTQMPRNSTRTQRSETGHQERVNTWGGFYKLRDKERSKESVYVLVAFCFLARPFVSFVSHIARYAPSLTDKSSSLRNQKSTQPNF